MTSRQHTSVQIIDVFNCLPFSVQLTLDSERKSVFSKKKAPWMRTANTEFHIQQCSVTAQHHLIFLSVPGGPLYDFTFVGNSTPPTYNDSMYVLKIQWRTFLLRNKSGLSKNLSSDVNASNESCSPAHSTFFLANFMHLQVWLALLSLSENCWIWFHWVQKWYKSCSWNGQNVECIQMTSGTPCSRLKCKTLARKRVLESPQSTSPCSVLVVKIQNEICWTFKPQDDPY